LTTGSALGAGAAVAAGAGVGPAGVSFLASAAKDDKLKLRAATPVSVSTKCLKALDMRNFLYKKLLRDEPRINADSKTIY
jgi:hypothetical protein